MGEFGGDWLLDIWFSHPYDGLEIQRSDGRLTISIPFASEGSALVALAELGAAVRPRHRVIPGEVLKGEQGRCWSHSRRSTPSRGAGATGS
jgi:hypothetical protein